MSAARPRRPAGSPEGPLGPEGFAAAAGVSRETLQRLILHAECLRKWQGAVNLVSAASLPDLWRRHMLDSAQLLPLLPDGARRLVDLGSGAGFPGLVLAILGVPEVHLVEADARKAAFLREAARAASLPPGRVVVHGCRIEAMAPIAADAVTARALAPLDRLLHLAEPFLGPTSICVFPKGARADVELTEAAKSWTMAVERFASAADPSGTILRLSHVKRRAERGHRGR